MGKQDLVYAFDSFGGPVYRADRVSRRRECMLRQRATGACLITVLVQDGPGAPTELRQYFALDLRQAICRAAELQVRLPALEVEAAIVGLRRATDSELDAFFRAIDRIEKEMPRPVTESDDDIRTTLGREQAMNNQTRGGDDARSVGRRVE